MDDNKEPETLAKQGQHMAPTWPRSSTSRARFWGKFLQGQIQESASRRCVADPLNAWPTFAELCGPVDNPKQVADKTHRVLGRAAAALAALDAALDRRQGRAERIDLPHMLKADKRFAHKDWSENAVFDYLKQSYLLASGFSKNSVARSTEGAAQGGVLHPLLRRGDESANFFALNPEVL